MDPRSATQPECDRGSQSPLAPVTATLFLQIDEPMLKRWVGTMKVTKYSVHQLYRIVDHIRKTPFFRIAV
jgi:hypothetical protein